MKKIILPLLLIVAILTNNTASAKRTTNALNRSCPKIAEVGTQSSTIYKQSAPIRSGGIGTPIVGYRKEPTLIMNSNISTRGTRDIYDSKGNRLGSCPWATAEGHPGGRLRCTMQTSSLRQSALKNTRSTSIYFSVTPKLCVRVPDAGRCYGSVKGPCNQLIS
jgi:hypothetical protein